MRKDQFFFPSPHKSDTFPQERRKKFREKIFSGKKYNRVRTVHVFIGSTDGNETQGRSDSIGIDAIDIMAAAEYHYDLVTA